MQPGLAVTIVEAPVVAMSRILSSRMRVDISALGQHVQAGAAAAQVGMGHVAQLERQGSSASSLRGASSNALRVHQVTALLQRDDPFDAPAKRRDEARSTPGTR